MKFKSMLYQNPIGFLSAFLFLLFAVWQFNLNFAVGISLFILSVIIFTAVCVLSYSNLKSTKKIITEINKSLKAENSDAVGNFPLPSIICNNFGEVIWYNDKFEADFLSEKSSANFKFGEVFRDYTFTQLTELETVDIEYNKRKFTVFLSKVNYENTPMLSMYFLDNTYLKDTEEEYRLSRPFVMYILIDNIDLLSRQFSDSKFAFVTSSIETIIEKWLREQDVVFKKISNRRFIVIGEKRSLDEFCNAKFSVLTSVKEYKYNNVPVEATLSIGVGTGGEFAECEEKAKKSLDMSLGRGGDQAVILDNNGYVFFGGMSNRMNDNSKVSPRQTSTNISNLIKKYDEVLIMGHKFSDFDSVGAALGMLYLSHINGIDARVVIDKKKSLATSLIELVEKEGYNLFIEPEQALKMCNSKTLLIVVDTHRPTLVECPELYDKSGSQIVIDHHRKMEDYISDAEIFYHKPTPSSTCEMVTELIEYSTIQEKLPAIIATCLLSGIVLDTKDFVLRTSKSTFEAAAFLRDNGANTVTVKKLFSIASDMAEIKNEIISGGTNYDGFMISVTENKDRNLRVISSIAADEMLNIENVKASFVISSLGESVNISARSYGEENVQLIMERLGGGGHSTMAAAQIKDCGLPEAKEKLRAAIDDYCKSK